MFEEKRIETAFPTLMDHGRSAEHAALSDVRKDEGRDWERVELVVAGCGGIPLLLDTT